MFIKKHNSIQHEGFTTEIRSWDGSIYFHGAEFVSVKFPFLLGKGKRKELLNAVIDILAGYPEYSVENQPLHPDHLSGVTFGDQAGTEPDEDDSEDFMAELDCEFDYSGESSETGD